MSTMMRQQVKQSGKIPSASHLTPVLKKKEKKKRRQPTGGASKCHEMNTTLYSSYGNTSPPWEASIIFN